MIIITILLFGARICEDCLFKGAEQSQDPQKGGSKNRIVHDYMMFVYVAIICKSVQLHNVLHV